MEELKKLEGKTIKAISFPKVLYFKNKSSDGMEYETDYIDDNIVIETEDGFTVKLASWDRDSYSSGIRSEVIPPSE